MDFIFLLYRREEKATFFSCNEKHLVSHSNFFDITEVDNFLTGSDLRSLKFSLNIFS